MLVDLYSGGHHPHYLELLRAAWESRDSDGELHVLVGHDYPVAHGLLLERIARTPGAQVHLASKQIRGESRLALVTSDRVHGRVVAQQVARVRPDHVLLMYFDHVQLSLAFGLRFSFPVRVSGIYFRPSFHYSDTGILVGRGNGSRATDARKRLMLLSAVRNPHFQTLFCLDPFAAEWLREHHPRVRAVDLPDPVDPVPIVTPPSNTLAGVGASRSKLLLFGALDDRKGVRPVVDALHTLRTEAQARLALVCAGPFVGAARAELLTKLEELRTNSAVEVVVEDRYHEESEIQPLVAGADLVLLTYDRHIGSSNVLVRAAAAATPVLAQEYGLLGALVRRHRLGRTLDARSPDAIATALTRWVVDGPSSITFDAASARAFASANISARFTETVFGELLKTSREGTAVESRGLRGS